MLGNFITGPWCCRDMGCTRIFLDQPWVFSKTGWAKVITDNKKKIGAQSVNLLFFRWWIPFPPPLIVSPRQDDGDVVYYYKACSYEGSRASAIIIKNVGNEKGGSAVVMIDHNKKCRCTSIINNLPLFLNCRTAPKWSDCNEKKTEE